MMKKILLAILCLSMVLSIPLNVFATEEEETLFGFEITSDMRREAEEELNEIDIQERLANFDKSKKLTQISEYDFVQRLSKESKKSLSQKGYLDEDIQKIYNYKEVYDNFFEDLAKLSKEQLFDLGYTSQQIEILNNYEGSERQISLLAAKCYIYANIDYVTYNYSTGRTKARCDYMFEWTSVPAFGMRDIIAVGWNEYWGVTGKTNSITYKNISSNNYKYGSGTIKEIGTGVSVAFNAKIDDNYYYAKEGIGIFVIERTGKHDLHVLAGYGHNQLGLTPSATIGISSSGINGGLSIKFSVGIHNLDDDYKYMFVKL